jgi:hypothetical protein
LKKNAAKKETIRSTLLNIRNCSAVGPRHAELGRKVKPLPLAKSSKIDHKLKNLSIHFPEGVIVTLKFHLSNSLTTSHVYNHKKIYQLTDIGLRLDKVKLKSEAINMIKKELQSVSIRHTS